MTRANICLCEPLENRRLLATATGFTISQVGVNISLPTAMAFAPDGRLFVCTQDGHLKVIKDGAVLGSATRPDRARLPVAAA